MAQLAQIDPQVLQTLRDTRSIQATADQLACSVTEVKRVALLAFGLGVLDVDLVDY